MTDGNAEFPGTWRQVAFGSDWNGKPPDEQGWDPRRPSRATGSSGTIADGRVGVGAPTRSTRATGTRRPSVTDTFVRTPGDFSGHYSLEGSPWA